MIAPLWIFLALGALARADENADRDVIRKILGTFNDQLARQCAPCWLGRKCPCTISSPPTTPLLTRSSPVEGRHLDNLNDEPDAKPVNFRLTNPARSMAIRTIHSTFFPSPAQRCRRHHPTNSPHPAHFPSRQYPLSCSQTRLTTPPGHSYTAEQQVVNK